MIRSASVVFVALAAALFCLPNTTSAQPAYQPAGVAVGETYHLVFASSVPTSAVFNDIGHYNTHVDNLGSASTYKDLDTVPGSWKAIVSTITAADGSPDPGEAFTNAPVSGDVYRVDGVQVSDESTANSLYQDPNNFFGILAPIAISEVGLDLGPQTSWGGSLLNGTRRVGDEMGALDNFASVGQVFQTNEEWLDRIATGNIWHLAQVVSNWFRFYGLSEPLVGVIPEPSAGILLGSGLVGLLLCARRKLLCARRKR